LIAVYLELSVLYFICIERSLPNETAPI